MARDAPDVAEAHLEPGGCEGDEPLEESARRATATTGGPQPFPDFVRLPVIAAVEQVDAVKVVTARTPALRIGRLLVLRS